MKPSSDNLTPEMARSVLRLDFRDADHRRVEKLLAKAQNGTLSNEEKTELDEFLQAADHLAVLQSKARRSLNCPSQAG
ncbi:MAG: hypothetical protein L0Y72_00525 [Gemmataceae bacterium]|nr:hypothetical protein [Gemmataceae bacterium]MCI0737494.1 hypothetical protein [Gemmataceae bacterium]